MLLAGQARQAPVLPTHHLSVHRGRRGSPSFYFEMKRFYFTLAVLNFISAGGFSIQGLFVTPTMLSTYYGVIAMICAFGFWLVSRTEK